MAGTKVKLFPWKNRACSGMRSFFSRPALLRVSKRGSSSWVPKLAALYIELPSCGRPSHLAQGIRSYFGDVQDSARRPIILAIAQTTTRQNAVTGKPQPCSNISPSLNQSESPRQLKIYLCAHFLRLLDFLFHQRFSGFRLPFFSRQFPRLDNKKQRQNRWSANASQALTISWRERNLPALQNQGIARNLLLLHRLASKYTRHLLPYRNIFKNTFGHSSGTSRTNRRAKMHGHFPYI